MIVYTELSTLESELGFPAKTLYGISNSVSRHYHRVEIPKRNGGVRILHVPDEALKSVQRAINEKLLAYEAVSPYATAYRYGATVRKNACRHVGKKALLKLDIKDFFDSISYSLVKEKVFRAEKYSEPLRVLLSMLCYRGDSLPQGAPTSPAITNIIMYDFDMEIGNYCRERGIAYTRYCDDMTFSSDHIDKNELIGKVSEELKKYGLRINGKKTVSAPAGRKQTVTGVTVNEKPNTDKEYRRSIRQQIYFCKKYGVDEHLKATSNPISAEKYLSSLLGRIGYVLQITPNNPEFTEYRAYVSDELKKY